VAATFAAPSLALEAQIGHAAFIAAAARSWSTRRIAPT
jgi:hypothetical protein